MKINWLFREYIKLQAKSRKTAVLCSRLHWWQLKIAGPKELKRALDLKLVDTHAGFCALCGRYEPATIQCEKFCPLRCGDVWGEAYSTLRKWQQNPTSINWRKWKKASAIVYEKLEKIVKRLYPKEERLK